MNATSFLEAKKENCSRAVPVELYILRSHDYEAFLMSMISVNALVAAIATVSNFVVIFTIARTVSLRTPSNILLLGLATTDLMTGLITQPIYFVTRYLEVQGSSNICTIYALSASVSWLVSPMTLKLLTAITADRFLAIKLQIRYKQIVTKKSAVFAVISILATSSVFSILRSFTDSWDKAAAVLVAVLMLFLLLLDVVFITSITKLIRRYSHQVHDQDSSNQSNFNILKYRKSANTMYCMLGAFVLCYLPYLIFLIFLSMSASTISIRKIYYFRIAATTFVYMNGIVNPLIYFRRNRKLLRSAGEIFGCA